MQLLFMLLSEIVQRLFIVLLEILQRQIMLLTVTLHLLTHLLLASQVSVTLQIVLVQLLLHLQLRAARRGHDLQGAIVNAPLVEVCTQLFILFLLLTKLQHEGVV